MLLLLIFSCLAYLIGSLSGAIIVCKCAGLPDPRTQGSGNPGASNVLRVGGKGLASIVLFFDIFKGWFLVIAAGYIGMPLLFLGWVAFFAFLGHLFPIFFRFRGGKGVATALGGLLALAWPVGLLMLLIWLLVLSLFRYISLASIVSAIISFFYALYYLPFAVCIPVFLMSALLISCHHANIRRLLKGSEPKLSKANLVRKIENE
jgi:glycerol-3-phosphate acyltransferase PlsY